MELNQEKSGVHFVNTLLNLFWLILYPILWLWVLSVVSPYTAPVGKIVFLIAGLISFIALVAVLFSSSLAVRKESKRVLAVTVFVGGMFLVLGPLAHSAINNFPGDSQIDKRAAAIQQAPGGQFRGNGATGSTKP